MSRKELLSSVSQHGLFSMRYFPLVHPSEVAKQRQRDEFGLAIRSTFLRYLIKVESREMKRLFTESELHDLSCGSIDNFNIHHIRGINIGGKNYNPKFTTPIGQIFLPDREVKGLSHRVYPFIVFKRRLERFLREKEERGQLKKTFENLFAGHLVLMPKALHEKLERQLIWPAIVEADEMQEKRILLPYTTRLFISPLSKEYKAMSKDGVTQFFPSQPAPPQKISSHRPPVSGVVRPAAQMTRK